MKKQKKKKQNVELGENPFEFFRLLLEQIGVTYSEKCFFRRLNLMTENEFCAYKYHLEKLIEDIDERFADDIEAVDEIMSIRAEKEEDEFD